MIEQYLSNSEIRAEFLSGARDEIQKQAEMTKQAQVGKAFADLLSSGWRGYLALAALSAGVGGLGGAAYNIMKDKITGGDAPEESFKDKISAYYDNKSKELEDQKWMARVRAMRDELQRGAKKMPADEYAKKYQALSRALDEKRQNPGTPDDGVEAD